MKSPASSAGLAAADILTGFDTVVGVPRVSGDHPGPPDFQRSGDAAALAHFPDGGGGLAYAGGVGGEGKQVRFQGEKVK